MTKLRFNKVKCPVCNSNKFKRFNIKSRHSSFPTKIGIFNLKCFDVICKECSFVYSNPEPTSLSLKKFYSNKFLNKSLDPDYDIKKQLNFFKKIAKKKQTILEIGSSNNYLVKILKKNGYKAYGSDFLTKTKIKNKKYDFILLNHTLEHIPNPKKYLIKIKDKIKDGGKIIIEVPDLNQYESDDTLLTAEHIHHFTDDTLKNLLINSGYDFIGKNKEHNSRKYSVRMIFQKSNIKHTNAKLNPRLVKRAQKIFTKALILNKKRMNNFKDLSNKINRFKKNEIYFWGCNSIFLNLFYYLNKHSKRNLTLVDENFKKIKYLKIDKKNEILIQNPKKNMIKKSHLIKFIICAISWKESIKKKIVKNGVSKKNILIPRI